MTKIHAAGLDAHQLLTRMFEVEMKFLQSETGDRDLLATAFHPDVVVREPATLPYPGDWRGHDGVAALFGRMKEIWSDVAVEGLEAVRSGDTVFMTCMLRLTARENGATIEQPFAEVLRFKDDLVIDGTPFYHDTGAITAALALPRLSGLSWS